MILQIYVPLREIFQYQGITKAALRRFLGHATFVKVSAWMFRNHSLAEAEALKIYETRCVALKDFCFKVFVGYFI